MRRTYREYDPNTGYNSLPRTQRTLGGLILFSIISMGMLFLLMVAASYPAVAIPAVALTIVGTIVGYGMVRLAAYRTIPQ